MSILGSFQLSRDRNVTVANLVDELLRRTGDREVSIESGAPFHLAQLHATICRMDAFLRRTVPEDWIEIDSSELDTPGPLAPHVDPYADEAARLHAEAAAAAASVAIPLAKPVACRTDTMT